MESSMTHVMLISFPGQGHISPLLRLGKLIASKGLLVTFVTTEEPLGKKMRQANKIQDGVLRPVGLGFLRFEFFADGFVCRDNLDLLLKDLEVSGRREIKNLVKKYEKKQPVRCLINNAYVPWVCDVAEELQIPSAVLWVQSYACLAAYYYFHRRLVNFPTETEPEISVEVPFKPLKHDEIPSFLHPSSRFRNVGDIILEQIKRLHKPFSILIDTFQDLERDTINHMSKLCPQVIIKPIGPLFMMSKTISSDITGDISEHVGDSIEWLDTKEPSSVVYISFGTVVHLKQEQIEEIAHGVLSSEMSFLWVERPPWEGFSVEPNVLPRELSLKGKGKIVEWCPQERVLAHPSVACFLSHCGWNSTMEALTSGVPMVCFPQWGDQVTNAVYMINVFKTGVRLSRGEAEDRIVPREEVSKRLLEASVGEKAVELRENALRWKEEAEAAVACGGSSRKSFQEFVDKLTDVRTTLHTKNVS
ncbi:UDP-glycosyltransferase 84A4 [Cardamine amara subsp. amara]|uniref:Glycosyltransferase n=1 Tax=Cardamine amara subsp. amara TaxID=228776 RepID=A0ABD1BTU8_CARAN